MNLLIIPTLQSCNFIFFTEAKIAENIPLDKSKTFAESIMSSDFWTETKNIFFVSGPASFTTLRNMSVFLETLQNFSGHESAENKSYNFYNIPTQYFLENCIFTDKSTKNLCLYSVGRREVFVFHHNTNDTNSQYSQYQKIKNKNLEEYVAKNTQAHTHTQCIGVLSENVIQILEENNITYINLENTTNTNNTLENNLNTTNILKNIQKYSNSITIDYGSLPTIG